MFPSRSHPGALLGILRLLPGLVVRELGGVGQGAVEEARRLRQARLGRVRVVVLHDIDVDHARLNIGPTLVLLQLVHNVHALDVATARNAFGLVDARALARPLIQRALHLVLAGVEVALRSLVAALLGLRRRADRGPTRLDPLNRVLHGTLFKLCHDLHGVRRILQLLVGLHLLALGACHVDGARRLKLNLEVFVVLLSGAGLRRRLELVSYGLLLVRGESGGLGRLGGAAALLVVAAVLDGVMTGVTPA